MYLKRVSHLRTYILSQYPLLLSDKMDIIKIGQRIYIILITADNKLVRERIFTGALESVNSIAMMKRVLDANILKVMMKHGFAIKQK